MGKDKLRRFDAIRTFKNVSEFHFGSHFKDENWEDYLSKSKTIILELGCGKGEYALNLAKRNKSNSYIGVDLKGNRIYIGANQALLDNIKNVHFLRTRIDFIDKFFKENTVDEIWLTFSDPQPKKPRKRLTSPLFINRYKKFLKPNGIIHLKTDSALLYDYTIDQIHLNKYELNFKSDDIYRDLDKINLEMQETLKIPTHYENLFSKKGFKIKYCQFSIS